MHILFTAKDQHLFQDGILMEAGLATSSFYTGIVPIGAQTYVVTPNRTQGNYYLSNHGRGERTESIGNLFLPPHHAAGKHELKLGVDVDRLTDHQEFVRQPYIVVRNNGTLSRRVSFINAPPYTRYDVEESGYLQDRWSVTQRLLLEPGIRLQPARIQIVRGLAAASPRLASTLPAETQRRNQDLGGHWRLSRRKQPWIS